MTRHFTILTLLIVVCYFAHGQNRPIKIRVAKGHVSYKGRLYQDRVYLNQLEFNLISKTVYKRKSEAKSFSLTKIAFPTFLSDSLTTEGLAKMADAFILNPCNTPDKNFFYKIDILYCDRYPTYIKTFEMAYKPFADNKLQDDNIFKKIVRYYFDSLQ